MNKTSLDFLKRLMTAISPSGYEQDAVRAFRKEAESFAAEVRTDVHGRALRDDGSVIEGLYAAGNVSAPVMGHTYPGPGGTIGPAMAFGYLAALHIAGKG